MGDQVDDVRPRPVRVDGVEQLGNVERAAAAVAGDDRGHALRLVVPVGAGPGRDDSGIGMRVQVDESRRHDPGGGVDHPGLGVDCERPDGNDPLAPDRHVSPAPGGAGAVDDRPVLEHQIGGDRLLRDGDSRGDQAQEGEEGPSQTGLHSHGVVLTGRTSIRGVRACGSRRTESRFYSWGRLEW